MRGQIKRYDIDGGAAKYGYGMNEDCDGPFVAHEDYESAISGCDRIIAEMRNVLESEYGDHRFSLR